MRKWHRHLARRIHAPGEFKYTHACLVGCVLLRPPLCKCAAGTADAYFNHVLDALHVYETWACSAGVKPTNMYFFLLSAFSLCPGTICNIRDHRPSALVTGMLCLCRRLLPRILLLRPDFPGKTLAKHLHVPRQLAAGHLSLRWSGNVCVDRCGDVSIVATIGAWASPSFYHFFFLCR